MKKLLILSVLLCVAYIAPATAQNDTLGWGRNSVYNRMYNPKTTVNIKGQIVAVEQNIPMKGMSAGIHLMVNTGSETISVNLGPKWYIDRQKMLFKKGDKVQVEGSKVMLDGQNTIIAREVKKGGQLLKLRDNNGIPQWSGWRYSK